MRRGRMNAPVVLATAALGLAVAGCGGGHGPGTQTAPVNGTIAPHHTRIPVLRIVASLPLTGPAAAQGRAALHGIELALRQARGRAGAYRLKLRSVDDAGSVGLWSTSQVATNALEASISPSTIMYIGELASGASQVSSTILSAAGIPQISPGSPAAATGSAAASPAPAARSPAPSTLLRLAPSNRAQAVAILDALSRVIGCTRVAVLPGGDTDGADLATWIRQRVSAFSKLKLLPLPQNPSGTQKSALPLAQWFPMVLREGANCGVYTGSLAAGGVRLIGQLHQSLVPPGVIVASSGVCTDSWASAAHGGEPAALAPYLECTAPGPPLSSPSGRSFAHAFRAAYGTAPAPLAAYGYEAMQLGLQAIGDLGTHGDERASVLLLLKGLEEAGTPIGSFNFDAQGQLGGPAAVYRLYEIRDGKLAPTSGKVSPGSSTTGGASGGSSPGGSTSTVTSTTETSTTGTGTTGTGTTPSSTTTPSSSPTSASPTTSPPTTTPATTAPAG